MLLTEKAIIKWNSNNKKYYESKGYKYTGKFSSLEVKVDNLSNYSKCLVDVACDYCAENGKDTIIQKQYCNYLKEREKYPKDTCNNCKYIKIKDINNIKQEHNEFVNKSENGYWTFKDNRISELKKYIDAYGCLDDINKSDRKLVHNLRYYKEHPMDLALEIGYNIDEIYKRKPKFYYQDFKRLEDDIKLLIDKYNSFPTLSIIKKELNISSRPIERHGGMYEIKRKMGYEDDLLIDNSGFYNSSFYELLVANFLIANEYKDRYQREQHPFPKEEGNYRSDFCFKLESGEEIHCEVWGKRKDSKYNTSPLMPQYLKTREIKELLYKKYNINLISIEGEDFERKSYTQITKQLYDIFYPYFKLEFKEIDYEVLIPVKTMTDDELYNFIKPMIKNNYLPSSGELCENGHRPYYNEIIKRYNSYINFAKKYGHLTYNKPNNYWTEDRINEYFMYMMNKYGRILNRLDTYKLRDQDEVINQCFSVLTSQYGGMIKRKLLFFRNYCIKNKIDISDIEIRWLYNLSKGISVDGERWITDENRCVAREILFILKGSGKLDSKYENFIRQNYNQGTLEMNTIFDMLIHMVGKYDRILPEKEYRKLKKIDPILNEFNLYKRIYKKGYDFKKIINDFNKYCNENNINEHRRLT